MCYFYEKRKPNNNIHSVFRGSQNKCAAFPEKKEEKMA